MTFYDGYADRFQDSGLPGELAARIADFLSRKSRELPERMETLCRLIEEKVLNEGLRDGLMSLVRHARWEREVSRNAQAEQAEFDQAEWDQLVLQIHRYGRKESIENYTYYLF